MFLQAPLCVFFVIVHGLYFGVYGLENNVKHELYQPGSRISCKWNEYRCNNGHCISADDKCDGTNHCSDGSDETFAACKGSGLDCPLMSFECSYGACIAGDLKCDGKVNCADGSDEKRCPVPERSQNRISSTSSCSNVQFQCSNGLCIDGTDICDGVINCLDGSDETMNLCVSVECPEGSFKCSYGACLDSSLKCDGNRNCHDGSDESGDCPKPSYPNIPVTRAPPSPPPTAFIPSYKPTPPTTNYPAPSADSCKLPAHPKDGAYMVMQCKPNDPLPACRNTPGAFIPTAWYIKYTCNSGYSLNNDYEYSICDNGVWENQLDCIKLCPPLTSSLSLNVRCFYGGTEVNCSSPMKPDTSAKAECKQHYKPAYTPKYSTLACLRTGEWDYPLYDCIPAPAPSAHFCILPAHPNNGAHMAMQCKPNDPRPACRNTPGASVPNAWSLKYTCNSGYSLNKDSEYSFCENGVWKNEPDCIKLCPPLTSSLSLNVRCFYGGTEVNCSSPMKPDTSAKAECKQHYKPAYTPKYSTLACLRTGEWDYPFYDCIPEGGPNSESTTIHTTSAPNNPQTIQVVNSSLPNGDGQPSLTGEQPASGEEPPASGEEPPASGEEPPASGEEPPALGEEPPALGEEQSPLQGEQQGNKGKQTYTWSKISSIKINKTSDAGFPQASSISWPEKADEFFKNNNSFGDIKFQFLNSAGIKDLFSGFGDIDTDPEVTSQDHETSEVTHGNTSVSFSTGCVLPEASFYRKFCSLSTGCEDCNFHHSRCLIPPGSRVDKFKIVCAPGYSIQTSSSGDVAVCLTNGWYPSIIPECLKLCQPLVSEQLLLVCQFGTNIVDCSQPALPNTTVTIKCRPSFSEYPALKSQGAYRVTITCGQSGIWTENLPLCKPGCGVTKEVQTFTPTVFNGTQANIGFFPWHAGLYYPVEKDGKVIWEQKCGGSLINDWVILTAAHCVKNVQNSGLRIALGKYYRSWDTYEPTEEKRNVSEIIVPDQYTSNTFTFDIALVLLSDKITLGEYIMPVCLDFDGGTNTIWNTNLYVVGWGRTNVGEKSSENLLYNTVKAMADVECRRAIPSFYTSFEKICALKKNSESVTQGGDSGGGLTAANTEGLHYIVGIVSTRYGRVSLFTKIQYKTHLDWIAYILTQFRNKYRS